MQTSDSVLLTQSPFRSALLCALALGCAFSLMSESASAGTYAFDSTSSPTGRFALRNSPYTYPFFGPPAEANHAEGNVVEINGSFKIPDGESKFWVAYGIGGWASLDDPSAVKDNVLRVSNVDSAYAQYSVAISDSGNVSGNALYISNSKLTQHAIAVMTANGNAYDNLICVENSELSGDIRGAYITISTTAEANRNQVIAIDSTVKENIVGADTNDGASFGNTIKLVNVKGTKNVYGAMTSGDTGHHQIYLLGSTEVSRNVSAAQSQEPVVQDDTTAIHVQGNVSVGSLGSFRSLVFELGEKLDPRQDDADLSKAMLEITGTDGLDLSGRVVVLENYSGALSQPLVELSGTNAALTTDADSTLLIENTFVSANYSLDGISIDELDPAKLGDRAQYSLKTSSATLSESLLGTAAFVSQGAEFIADEGIQAMAAAAKSAIGPAAFAAVHGGRSTYKTGSRVRVDGVTLAAGAAAQSGGFLGALFFEAGWADSKSRSGSSRGDADHDYYGLGAAARYEFDLPFYIEGSVRGGWATTDFTGRYAGTSANYKAESFYGTAHAAAGMRFDVSARTQGDLFLRYAFTHLEGDDARIGSGSRYVMDDVNAHAFRLGLRFSGPISEKANWRAGLAYEHVADGDAESKLRDLAELSLDTPTLEGDYGMLEIGCTSKPRPDSPWSFDFSLKGYAGDREGAAGSAAVLYSF